jgi:hypothetical protein
MYGEKMNLLTYERKWYHPERPEEETNRISRLMLSPQRTEYSTTRKGNPQDLLQGIMVPVG